ncbi:unnamed protein product [Boreogadus saida]
MDNDAPCAMGAQRPPVDTTGRAGEPAAAHRPLVSRTAVRLPKYSGVTQLEPYLAQFRLAAVVHLALALEGTAAQVLLDLDQADQRDLQALIRALERRLGERISRNESKQLLASHRRREEESLGVYAADVQLLTRRSYPEFSAATREALALHAFLRGLQPESLGQHVRLTDRPSMRLWTRRNGLRRSSAAVHPWTRLGQRPPPAQRTWSGRAGSGRPPFPPPRRLRLPGHYGGTAGLTLSRSIVGSLGWSRAAGGRGSVPPTLVPAAGVAVGRPDVGVRRRMGARTALQRPPTAEPGGGPDGGGGAGPGPLNNQDCAVGVGVVGTSDP